MSLPTELRLRASAGLLLAFALPLVPAAAQAGHKPATATAVCPGPGPRAPRFGPGEAFRYRLDLLGTDVGTFEISIDRPPPSEPHAQALLRSRAHTSAFVSTNIGRYEAFSETLLGPGLQPLRYREETDEGDTHRSQAVEFPPRGDQLAVRTTHDGKPEDLTLAATAQARDMLSAWLAIRGTPLTIGAPFCSEIYAGKKMWRVSGAVAAKEEIETPMGNFRTVRIDTVATRADEPSVARQGHFWVTDDARRLPVVAIAEVKGKTVRAQLAQVVGPDAPPPAPKRARHEELRSNSGSASIGRR